MDILRYMDKDNYFRIDLGSNNVKLKQMKRQQLFELSSDNGFSFKPNIWYDLILRLELDKIIFQVK